MTTPEFTTGTTQATAMTAPGRKWRVAFLNTHPIQYFAPMYRFLSRSDDLSITALYLSDFSVRGATDRAFGRVVKWDVDLLDGYDARFVAGADKRPEPGGFTSVLAPAVWNEVRRGGFDAVVAHGHTPAALLVGIAAAASAHIPVFMRGETHLGLARAGWKEAIRRPVIGGLYRRLDGVLAIGTANAQFYRAMGVPRSRVFSMPYTIDNARFIAGSRIDGAERVRLRKSLGVADDDPIVLYAAKFQRRKRPDDLLRAARRLERNGVPCHVVMVGSGEMEAELRALAAELECERVRFHGFVNQSELPRVYAASDVFVLPSTDEPWGLAINEAMCASLPIVVSREVGCVPDLVHDGVNGRTFESGNIEQLSEALADVLRDSALRRSMSTASRDIISRWSYAECRDGLRTALATVATHSRPRSARAVDA